MPDIGLHSVDSARVDRLLRNVRKSNQRSFYSPFHPHSAGHPTTVGGARRWGGLAIPQLLIRPQVHPVHSAVDFESIGSNEQRVASGKCGRETAELLSADDGAQRRADETWNITGLNLQGTSMRLVECQFTGNGSRAPEELCRLDEKPSGEKKCMLPVCGEWPISHTATIEHNHTSRNQWRTGSWGTVC